ncbi:hypothetical protein T07_3902 [Trichinella nelsoni]|uniref:Uncharacterized protein n=1 Tax=Trichinella nelsoni TaxID=6336 RepID=A0A0V0S3C5_9BILA|nr:hypothetical protein T07_3902 [Trichinella nelsoni]
MCTRPKLEFITNAMKLNEFTIDIKLWGSCMRIPPVFTVKIIPSISETTANCKSHFFEIFQKIPNKEVSGFGDFDFKLSSICGINGLKIWGNAYFNKHDSRTSVTAFHPLQRRPVSAHDTFLASNMFDFH